MLQHHPYLQRQHTQRRQPGTLHYSPLQSLLHLSVHLLTHSCVNNVHHTSPFSFRIYMYLSNKIKYHIYIMLVSDLRECFHAVSLERVWFSVRLTSDICNPL